MTQSVPKRFLQPFRNNNLSIPALFTAFLIITAFYPIPQIVLLELFSLYEPLTNISTLDLMSTYYIVNSVLSVGILVLFYYTSGTFWIIISNTLAMLFMYPTLVYAFHELSTPIKPLLLAAIVFGLGMVGIAILKMRNRISST